MDEFLLGVLIGCAVIVGWFALLAVLSLLTLVPGVILFTISEWWNGPHAD